MMKLLKLYAKKKIRDLHMIHIEDLFKCFSDVVMGIEKRLFEEEIDEIKEAKGC